MFHFDINRIRLFFCKDRESYFSLYRVLGFYPRHIEFYQQAFLHKSMRTVKQKGHYVNNERLEFLGDAILDAIVGDIVYHHFQGKREGFLTNTRSNIVKRETLNRIALEMGLDKLMKCDTAINSHNNYMYGNAFEALIGAVYLDKGYNYCKDFVNSRILKQFINIDKAAYKEVNFKSKLIEWAQKNRSEIEFKLVEEFRDTNQNSPIFKTEVWLKGIYGGSGTGYSKRESQQVAAKETLRRIKKDQNFLDSILAVSSQELISNYIEK